MIGGMLLADNVLSSANGPAPSSTTWESNLEVKSILIGINHIKSVHRVCFSLFLPLLIDNYNHWSAWWLNSDDPQTLLFHFISEDVFILSFVFIIIIRDIVVIIITTHKIKPPEEVLLPALSLPGLSLRGRLQLYLHVLDHHQPQQQQQQQLQVPPVEEALLPALPLPGLSLRGLVLGIPPLLRPAPPPATGANVLQMNFKNYITFLLTSPSNYCKWNHGGLWIY